MTAFFPSTLIPFLVQYGRLYFFQESQLSGTTDLSSTARGTNPTPNRRRIRLLHSQSGSTRCQTWCDSSRSLWTPSHSSVTHLSSSTRGVLTVLILRPLSYIPMSASGCDELVTANPRKTSSDLRKFSPVKETLYTVL